MAAGGRFQLWPTVQPCPNDDLADAGIYPRPSLTLSYKDSLDRTRPRGDSSSTLQSHYDSARAPPAISQQTSASAIRDMALRKGRPYVRAAVVERDPAGTAPPLTNMHAPSQRSNKFTKLFAKHKSPKITHQLKIVEVPKGIESVAPDDASEALLHGCKDLDSAKINIRRPPKGVQNWFDALDDDNDDDFPEVVEQTSNLLTALPAFRPSLGPARSRAAPTSIRSQPDSTQDYFHFNRPNRRWESTSDVHSTSKQGGLGDPNEQSTLSLSSDEDDGTIEQPSPDWEDNVSSLVVPGSRDGRLTTARGARPSITSMQTMTTSGTIPFVLSMAPDIDAPPIPTPPVYPEQDGSSLEEEYLERASFLPLFPLSDGATRSFVSGENGSINSRETDFRRDISSFSSTSDSEPSHMMVVTEEEMMLLEMMRKKRAEMAAFNVTGNSSRSSASSPSKRRDMSLPELPRPAPLENGFGSLTLDGDDYLVFPCPPSSGTGRDVANNNLRASRASRGRSRSPAPSHTAEALRDVSPPMSELEAIPYTGATKKTRSHLAYSTDSYQLAPDIVDFSPFDLMPLSQGSVHYTPSLATSLSSCQTPSYDNLKTPPSGSEAGSVVGVRENMTPVRKAFGNASALGIHGDLESPMGEVSMGMTPEDMEVQEKERPMSVAIDVMRAWGALGGVVS